MSSPAVWWKRGAWSEFSFPSPRAGRTGRIVMFSECREGGSSPALTIGALADLLQPLGMEGVGDRKLLLTGVTDDSRQVCPGSLFIAVKGYAADGHRFIPAAIKAGAAAVVSDRDFLDAMDGCCCIRVDDSRRALGLVAAAWYGYPAREIDMIGVTGTNGKTTTARMLRHLLDCSGTRCGYIGTGMALWGSCSERIDRTTPGALELHCLLRRMADDGCEAVVMEVSSHALSMQRVAGIRFRGAVFTNLTPEHLDFHGSIDAYAEAKKILFSMLDRNGFAVCNADDPAAAFMVSASSGRELYGCRIDGQLELPDLTVELRASGIVSDITGTTMTLHVDGRVFNASFRLFGSYNVMNMLEAYAAGLAMGLGPEEVIAALADAPPVAGRMEVIGASGGYVGMVDYAHTPDALERVLLALRQVMPDKSRLVTVFGCGGDRDRHKRPEMGRIASKLSDNVVLTSDNPRSEHPECILDEIAAGIPGGNVFWRFRDRRDAISCGVGLLSRGDVLLVAGKGNEEYQEEHGQRHYFSDRDVLQEIVEQRR
ncbi:UDP-N-acetylmuramoyl-L-alanyl-D-glutamate--2,6-diaminopimelate ligase [Prosthecochloris sp. CIB 2401]|uniref:UDP-N-acetylmuramoyl-L-alanyl-D-glutamate--2, 6-diaminopimelate ligase n=1 Tax=Prosthecochloris sp. CIB 2401 TaxID=1868325 RepID=UPI003002A655